MNLQEIEEGIQTTNALHRTACLKVTSGMPTVKEKQAMAP